MEKVEEESTSFSAATCYYFSQWKKGSKKCLWRKLHSWWMTIILIIASRLINVLFSYPYGFLLWCGKVCFSAAPVGHEKTKALFWLVVICHCKQFTAVFEMSRQSANEVRLNRRGEKGGRLGCGLTARHSSIAHFDCRSELIVQLANALVC